MVLEYSRLCFFSYTTLLCSFFFNDTATTEIYTLSLHDALPISTNPVYRRRGGVADLEGAALDPGSEHLVAPGGDRVEDLELATVRGDPTLVSYLPTPSGIKRVLRENHIDLILGLGHRLDGENSRLDLLALVTYEAALEVQIPERRDHPVVTLHGLPGTLALRPHRRLKTSLVERDPQLRQYLPRHLNRKAVRDRKST